MSDTDEALKIWNALKPVIDTEIEVKTKSCVRAKKMTVSTVPDGSVIGVTEPYNDEIFVPYSSLLSNAQIDDAVWVWWFYDNASTMIALSMGDGQIAPSGAPGGDSVTVSLNNTSVTSTWTNAGGTIASGPTTAVRTLSFNVQGVPDGATVTSAIVTATFSSPPTGAALITVDGTSVATGEQSVEITPTETGNGIYPVQVKFRANGNASLADGSHMSKMNISNPTLVVTYSV